ncbi:MAG TPA: PIG-L deacetylase family protein [Actinomycetota bacterium]|nr:PIG-L deacetylase family protein [Actinomycetota bacterium]
MSKSFRALAVTAHPDDMEFGAAGTLAKWADAGAEVTLCIGTDGSTGTQDAALAGEELQRIRVDESERAAEVVGIKEIVWLGYRDGYVEYTLDLRKDLARVFRKYRPHRFMVMDPTPVVMEFINHPDHRAIGQASLDVSMTAGTTPGHFPELIDEGFVPWRGLREVWIAGPGLSPRVVDISDTIDRKIDALMCHKSQVGDNAEEIAGFVRQYTAEIGKKAGFEYGESFRVLAQGPGFHAGEQEDDVDLGDLAEAPKDFRA